MWWQVAKVDQGVQLAKGHHKHQSHQLQSRKFRNLPAKVEVETVDHNALKWPMGPGSKDDRKSPVSADTARHSLPAKVWSRDGGSKVAKLDLWVKLAKGDHKWWQVAKVDQGVQLAKGHHKHQSHQLQSRKFRNLPAKVEVETVDHNALKWPMGPGSKDDRKSPASADTARHSLPAKIWSRDCWSQVAKLDLWVKVAKGDHEPAYRISYTVEFQPVNADGEWKPLGKDSG